VYSTCRFSIGDPSSTAFWGLTKTAYGKRIDFRSCNFWGNCTPIWRNINTEIITWDQNEIGNRMKYSWYEIDSSPIKEIEIGSTVKFGAVSVTGKVKFNLEEKRLALGESYVEYCDDANGNGYMYSSGTFLNFHVKQQ